MKLLNACLAFILLLTLTGPHGVAQADHTAPPETVTIAGTFQDELGCPGPWQPECDKTFLTYDAEDDIWQATFDLPANTDEQDQPPRYKAALNGAWGENYGADASQGGADIPLELAAATPVKFYYDHKTHWVTDSFSKAIATVVGDFQTELGCTNDNDPGCLRGWLQDPDGTGTYALVTTALPAGTYEVKVAINESMDENYGAEGALDGPAIPFTVAADGDEIFFGYDPASHELLVSTAGAPHGSLSTARAYWVTRDTIVWPGVGGRTNKYFLHFEPVGGLTLAVEGVIGGEQIPLTFAPSGPGAAVLRKFPHLTGLATLKLNPEDVARVPEILKGKIALSAWDENNKLLDATTPQIPGVLDDLFSYTGSLGVTYEGGVPTVRVWAPTARAVSLHLYADANTTTDQVMAMSGDAATGVWTAVGAPEWTGQYYLFEVEVYVPSTGQVEYNLVTDPYSISLSRNSTRSQIVDLKDPALMPDGWDILDKPSLAAPEDVVVYELHIRDFSIHDGTVPEAERGTYLAFTKAGSNGMKHLQSLAEAGLSHVHLLPAFDIASVNEDKSTWESVDENALAALPPDSDEQQAAVNLIKDRDGFNWGYDPLHYTTPDGSYAINPEGPARILEFRQMVQALNGAGLRVVMDVVYNHTNASGQNDNSVLDKVVPGYYHRLNAEGAVERSTCCENTATEHAMMEKLMIDSLVTWATAYKVDGFRFDLMGHHMLSNMVNVRAALDAVDPSIYIYGEGWDFGEVALNARGQNATQLNIGGTGIGVFNDRLRDAARGGGPFGDPREQGYFTGKFLDASDFDQEQDASITRPKLLEYTDWIRIGLAGNLKNYPLVDAIGHDTTGADVTYNDAPAGYTLDPQENINYVSAHDNETMFDAIQWKAPISASVAERVRMQNLGASLVLLGQGVPFVHAGDELLRSKSLERDSYNSGDWFRNRLDYSYQTNNWGVGLPPNGTDRWDDMRPRLANPALRPGPGDIQAALAHFKEMLAIRRSSGLFRLRTADEIIERLRFYNTGPDQIPGLIVMSLENTGEGRLADAFDRVVVIFNANPTAQSFADAAFAGADFQLHPLQQSSKDELVSTSAFDGSSGRFNVPGRTTAVFVVVSTAPAATATTAANATSTPSASPATPSTPLALTIIVIVIAALLGGIFAWQRRNRSTRG